MDPYLRESVTLLKDWAIWTTGIQTGTIAILGTFLKDGVALRTRRWALFTFISFILSILGAVWLVLMLPSILERLATADAPAAPSSAIASAAEGGSRPKVYEIPIHHDPRVPSISVGLFVTITHLLFIIGIIFFAACLYSRSKRTGQVNTP